MKSFVSKMFENIWTNKKLALFVSLSIIALFGLLWLFKYGTNITQSSVRLIENKADINISCLVSEGCVVDLGNNHGIKLFFNPSNLKPLVPIQLTLKLPKALQAKSVTLQFEGKQMPMHIPPAILQKVEKHIHIAVNDRAKKSDNEIMQHWQGSGMLTYCTVNPNMVWLAKLSIETVTQSLKINFELKT